MNHVFIKEFKLKQRKLNPPKFLDLEKVKKHRNSIIDSSRKISKILNDGHEIIGIDCEMFEFDQSKTTEVGIGRLSNSGLSVEHIIISDYYNLRNKKRVPDNKDNFVFGSSVRMTLEEANLYIKDVFSDAKYVYGHALKNDLAQLGVKVSGQVRFDTSTLHTQLTVAKDGIHTTRKTSLSRLCEIYTPELSETPYHNAGNDIYVTGAVLRSMSDLDSLSNILSELDDEEIVARTKNDEINRIIKAIPILNRDLAHLMNETEMTFKELLSNPLNIESIISVHQNIYRRIMKHGDKSFWLDKVDLGFVGELFEFATPIPEKTLHNKLLKSDS
ncbi:hypothetical protein K6U70_08965 [Vibrio vulnificus]|uniref:hypothetical protein n=1 Tax=Vibrio vulnificus TaxID=672 RepID=UPI001EEBB82C|nr:hypothetical protein [Vibrio vulnificus]MCG6272296.1 hypothetical protein [Vibrio vulnificus]